MNKNVVGVKLVKNSVLDKFCLKTNRGTRLTDWFKSYDEKAIGDFVKLETDVGTFVYHKNKQELLYEVGDEDEEVYVYKLTEDIYYMQVDCSDYTSLIQFYRPNGDHINMPVLEDVCPIGNDLIAAKEFLGKWGVLDKDLNWLIRPTYEEIFEFVNGYASGYRSESDTTDLISLDENSNILIVNVDGYCVQHLTRELVVVRKNKKHGVYNTKGEKILDIVYDKINLIGKHFVLLVNDLFGLADISGKVLRECKYYQIWKTKNGFELITRKIIDTTEHIVL